MMGGEEKRYCDSTSSALFYYLTMGLEPGSFCKALLTGDMQNVYQLAHPHLRPGSNALYDGEDIVKNFIELVADFPPGSTGTEADYKNWIATQGFSTRVYDSPEMLEFLTEKRLTGDIEKVEDLWYLNITIKDLTSALTIAFPSGLHAGDNEVLILNSSNPIVKILYNYLKLGERGKA